MSTFNGMASQFSNFNRLGNAESFNWRVRDLHWGFQPMVGIEDPRSKVRIFFSYSMVRVQFPDILRELCFQMDDRFGKGGVAVTLHQIEYDEEGDFYDIPRDTSYTALEWYSGEDEVPEEYASKFWNLF